MIDNQEIGACCVACGVFFVPMRKAVGKYCSKTCMHQHRLDSRPPFFECSKCLASIGLGMTVVSRLLHADKATISRAWRKEGIVAQLPKCGSWRIHAQINDPSKLKWWGNSEKKWMSEYEPKFFDWSSIALHEVRKRKSRDYQSMMHHTSLKNSNFRLKKIARSRIYNAIKRIGTSAKPRIRYRTERMIGCSIEQFANHLESKFKKGMSWSNHGTEWHIDHIIPLSHFNLTNENQLMTASHYTNMQPLFACENLRKGDRLMESSQMHLAMM